MQVIYEDKNRRIVSDKESINFSSFSSFHLFIIKVRETKNFGLRIDKKVTFNIKPSHELQIIYVVTFLYGKNHILSFEKRQKNSSLMLESLEVFIWQPDTNLTLEINNQAEDGDRRPWVTCILNNLPLASFTYTLTYSRRKRDSDDVKLVVDYKVQGNLFKTIKYKFWKLIGSFLPWISPTKTETETININLPQQYHLIEFIADRMPILHNLTLDFGTIPIPPSMVPTVDDPKWTGDFSDDSDEILLARLIFGEAEGVSERAKIAVGWTVKNRVLAQRKNEWGLTYQEVILKPYQYEAFVKRERLIKLTNPLNTDDETVKKAWYDSYKIAKQIIDNSIADPTEGATNFYSTPIDSIPSWATENRFKIQIDNLYFHKL